MGESLVHSKETDYKIGSYSQPPSGLSVSVSFGRFESDSLSWEKWSTFSSNKYLEEAEKFSRPGSVAQKKAYFEAHYKKIASKKDDFSDQEDENKACVSGFHEDSDIVQEFNEIQSVEKTHNYTEISQISLSEREIQEFDEMMRIQWPNEEGVFKFKEADSSHDCDSPPKLLNDGGNVDDDMDSVVHSSLKSEDKMSNSEKLTKMVVKDMGDSFEKQKTSKDVIVDNDVDIPKDVACLRNSAKQFHNPRTRSETKPLYKKENMISGKNMQSEKLKKPNPVTRKNSMVPSALQSLHSSMNRASNRGSEPTNFFNSSFCPASKKSTSSPMARRKSNSVHRTNHSVSSSVHLPLCKNSISPVTADSLGMTRKPMIMERMGDKEIVKRAFRTFQNDFDRLNISHTKITSAGNQKTSLNISRSIISSSIHQQNNKSLGPKDSSSSSSKVTSRTLSRDEKPKEVEKKSKLEVKDKVLVRSKQKEGEKDGVPNKSKHGLNFKATPMPRFYKGVVAPRASINRDSSTT